MHFDICFPRYHTGGQEPDSEEHNRILIFPWVTPSHSQPYLSMITYLTVTHCDSDTDSREECLMHIGVLLFLYYLQIDNTTQHSYGLFFGAGNLNLHYKCTSGKKCDANVLKGTLCKICTSILQLQRHFDGKRTCSRVNHHESAMQV